MGALRPKHLAAKKNRLIEFDLDQPTLVLGWRRSLDDKKSGDSRTALAKPVASRAPPWGRTYNWIIYICIKFLSVWDYFSLLSIRK
jgi:hypothetical protein